MSHSHTTHTENTAAIDAPLDWPQLDRWLKTLYAPSLPPLLTHTPALQATLTALHTTSTILHSARTLLTNLHHEALAEYQALTHRTTHTLQAAGLSPGRLPESTHRALASLSHLALTLELSNMHTESFECAVAQQTVSGGRRTRELESLREQRVALGKRAEESRERQRRLRILFASRRTDAVVEQQKAREWRRNAQVIGQKTEEYERRLDELMRARSRPREYHELRRAADVVAEVQEDVEAKRSAVEGYAALPPDISLAYLRLEEAKQALDRLRANYEHAVSAAFES
ncbi:hypothetical protein IW150_002413 [Coemansia sp. RSA 2607]|nr:hypothetical protein IW150_002413 [Coemansia sp. RSA 2607]